MGIKFKSVITKFFGNKLRKNIRPHLIYYYEMTNGDQEEIKRMMNDDYGVFNDKYFKDFYEEYGKENYVTIVDRNYKKISKLINEDFVVKKIEEINWKLELKNIEIKLSKRYKKKPDKEAISAFCIFEYLKDIEEDPALIRKCLEKQNIDKTIEIFNNDFSISRTEFKNRYNKIFNL